MQIRLSIWRKVENFANPCTSILPHLTVCLFLIKLNRLQYWDWAIKVRSVGQKLTPQSFIRKWYSSEFSPILETWLSPTFSQFASLFALCLLLQAMREHSKTSACSLWFRCKIPVEAPSMHRVLLPGPRINDLQIGEISQRWTCKSIQISSKTPSHCLSMQVNVNT